jgi:tRNA-modifying protein YgfZ
MLPYGEGVEVAGAFDGLELEYAAVRKLCGLMHLPQRTVLEVTGADRMDYLNRMLTQELKGVGPGSVRRSFWLSKQGRVVGDLRVVVLPERVLLDVDVHAAGPTAEGLGAYVVMEEVEVKRREVERLSLHGPTAGELLAALFGSAPAEGACEAGRIAGLACVVWREDSAGVPGYELVVERSAAVEVWRALITSGHDASHGAAVLREGDRGGLAAKVRLRPIGWHAYNIARIEAGTAVFGIDFGTRSLPAETGVLADRVSFTKGCYLGQEVVARMHARGAFKQRLVGVKFDGIAGPEVLGLLPGEGAELFPVVDGVVASESVGAVTSSTIAPMLGSSPIAFAAVRYTHVAPGTVLAAMVEGREVRGTVQEKLRFLPS